MKTAARLTSTQRDLALARLRSVTVGAAVASTAAAGAFGYLAVQTNAGTQAAAAAADSNGSTTAAVVPGPTSTATPGPTTPGTSSGTTSSGTTSSGTASSALQPTPTPAATATPATTKRHATSGGS